MRDPRTDPQEGDIIRLGDKRRLIKAIRDGEVYAHRLDSNDDYSLMGFRIPMEAYRQQAAEADVERIGWPEESDL